MNKKLYSEKIVKPESVSFIIGKNGCHIKDITAKIRNGAYIEYKTDGHRFIVSAYSKESLAKLIYELNNLLFMLRKAFIQGRYDSVSVGALKGFYRNGIGPQFRNYAELYKNLQNLEIKAEKMRLRLKPHKTKDVAVYRFQLEIFENSESVRHNFFGVFLTSLIVVIVRFGVCVVKITYLQTAAPKATCAVLASITFSRKRDQIDVPTTRIQESLT